MEETRHLIDAIIVVLISKYSNTPMFTFNMQYVGTWFPWFQGHPLISGAMPLESGAGFA